MSINIVTISGNLTRDPEFRRTPGGVSVLNIGVAVNDRKRNPQTNKWEEYPNFVECTMFGRRAEALSERLHKGMKVFVQGRLHYSSWDTENGRRNKLDVTVEEIEFQSQQAYRQQQAQPVQPAQQPVASAYADEDIPF